MVRPDDSDRLILVVYDTKARRVLGKGGKFMTWEDFDRDPPFRQKDIVPGGGTVEDPDPGLTVKCINGIKHYCVGMTCVPFPGPVAC